METVNIYLQDYCFAYSDRDLSYKYIGNTKVEYEGNKCEVSLDDGYTTTLPTECTANTDDAGFDYSSFWMSYTVPTAAPSPVPTAPSFLPTVAPSAVPSLTNRPSFAPTVQTAPDISFKAYVSSTGYTSQALPESAKTAFGATVADLLGIDRSRVVYISHMFIQVGLRRLAEQQLSLPVPKIAVPTEEQRQLLELEQAKHIQAVYSLIMNFTVTVNMIDFPTFTSTTDLYENLTSTLSDAVDTSKFIETLQANAEEVDVTIFDSATIILVNDYEFAVNSPPTRSPTYQPTSRNPIKYTSGELAGIVLAVLVGSAILFYLVYFILGALRASKYQLNDDSVADQNLEEALTSVVPSQQGAGRDDDQIVIVNNENFELAF